MTEEEMHDLFAAHEDEARHYDRIAVKLSDRPDIHGMLMLNWLDPQTGDIISAADHDQVWFAAKPEVVARNITEDQVKDLLRCGIYFEDGEGFWAFV